MNVEYLNFQDEIYHNATDGRYDQKHIPQQQIPYQDDIAAVAAPATLPLQPPFLGGPKDTSLLHSSANHVALPLWYNSNNISVIFSCLKLSYATQFKCFNFLCVFV